ncbi:MAG: hypothetical protein U1F55_15215 [Chitinivorax sp.]
MTRLLGDSGIVSGQCDKNGYAPWLSSQGGNIHDFLPFFSFSLETRCLRCSEKLPIFQIVTGGKAWPASVFPLSASHDEYFPFRAVFLLNIMYINNFL